MTTTAITLDKSLNQVNMENLKSPPAALGTMVAIGARKGGT